MANPITTLDNDLDITGNFTCNNLTVLGSQTGGGSTPGASTPNTLAGYNNAGLFSDVTIGTNLTLSGGVLNATGGGGGSGTVTSVGLTAPANSFFTVSGSPVTTNGNLTITPAAAKGDLPYASAANTISNLTIGTTGQILTVSAGGIPSWATSGGGTGTVTSVGLITAANSFFTVSGSPITTNGSITITPAAAKGDLPYASAANTISNLTIGTTGQILTVSAGGLPSWVTSGGGTGTVTSVASTLTGLPFMTVGGSPVTTNGTLTYTAACAVGDIIYGSASNVFSKLGIGTTGQVLTVAGGIPSWATTSGTGTVTSVGLTMAANSFYTVSGSPVTTSGSITITPAATKGDLPYASAANTISNLAIGTTGQILSVSAGGIPSWITGGAGTGTVTSVTFTGDGTVLSSTPSAAVTTAGTVTASLATAAPNTILAAQNAAVAGSAAAPTYAYGFMGSTTTAITVTTVLTAACPSNLVLSPPGNITLTFPQASTCPGKVINVQNTTGHTITMTLFAGDTIEGVGTFGLGPTNNTGAVAMISNGSLNTWNWLGIANTVPVSQGGTGLVSVTNGGVLAGASGAWQETLAGTTGQLLQSAGAGLPTWTSAPGSGTSLTSITATHQIAGGAAPTVAAGAGAGTGPTISITGHDTDCQVTLTTGTVPTGTNAVIATITYGTTYTTIPYSQMTSANANAATLASAVLQPYVTNTATTCVITSGTTGLAAATQYVWNIHTGL